MWMDEYPVMLPKQRVAWQLHLKSVWPSIFPPGEIQNSIECPGFLQLGQMLACGGRDAGRAVVGDDGESCTLDDRGEFWDRSMGRTGDRLGNVR